MQKSRVKSPNYYLPITNYFRQRRGFTLMELMVVVALVLIIIGVGMTNYITQMKRSRDTRRKSDLEQIRSALEMYRADNGTYPYTAEGCGKHQHIDGSDCLSNILEAEGYIGDVPIDPMNSGTGGGPCGGGRYGYMYGTDGDTYRLWTHLEITSDYTSNCDHPYGSCSPTSDCYQVQNP